VVDACYFSATGRRLMLVDAFEENLRVYDIGNAKPLSQLKLDSPRPAYALSPDGLRYALASSETAVVHVRNAATSKLVQTLRPAADKDKSQFLGKPNVTYSPNGRFLVETLVWWDDTPEKDGEAVAVALLYDLESGSEIARLTRRGKDDEDTAAFYRNV